MGKTTWVLLLDSLLQEISGWFCLSPAPSPPTRSGDVSPTRPGSQALPAPGSPSLRRSLTASSLLRECSPAPCGSSPISNLTSTGTKGDLSYHCHLPGLSPRLPDSLY